jgi:Uma2 family endonuclease
MALHQSKPHWISPEDYLAGELVSDVKHEYIAGEVFAMTGTSINHNRILGNVFTSLHTHLADTPCSVFGADIKVKAGNHFFYPDIIVDCEPKNGDEYVTDTPLIIVEVLSKSTRKLDQTLKRLSYQSLPSLQEYVLVEQDFVDIEVCRCNNHWQPEHYYLGDKLYLAAIDLHLPVENVYARVANEDMLAFLKTHAEQG